MKTSQFLPFQLWPWRNIPPLCLHFCFMRLFIWTMTHHPKIIPSSTDLFVISEDYRALLLALPPWDTAAWHPSSPPFTRNAFLSLQSPHVQIVLLYPGSVQVPLFWLHLFLNSFPYLGESACFPLLSHGIWFTVLFRVLFTLWLVLYSYLYIHPRPYLFILALKA